MPKRTLMVELRVGEVLTIAEPGGLTVIVKLETKTGSRARLRIDADSEIRIRRPDQPTEQPIAA